MRHKREERKKEKEKRKKAEKAYIEWIQSKAREQCSRKKQERRQEIAKQAEIAEVKTHTYTQYMLITSHCSQIFRSERQRQKKKRKAMNNGATISW